MTNKVIVQTEPLFTVRSRAMLDDGGIDSRGFRSVIRLLNYAPSKHPKGKNGTNYDRSLKNLSNPNLGFSDFLLQTFDMSLEEKSQVVTTFGDGEVAYFFGKAPVVANFSGVIPDDIDNQWFINFITMYQTTLRGTALAQRYELAELTMQHSRLIGPILSCRISQGSESDTNITFSMQMLVKSFKVIPPIFSNDALDAKVNYLTSKLSDLYEPISQSVSYTNKLKASIRSSGAELGYGATPSTSYESVFGAVLNRGAIPEFGPGAELASSVNKYLQAYNGYLQEAVDLINGFLSPVFGLLSSLTSLIKTVAGDVVSFLNAAAAPVLTGIAAVRSIAGEVSNIVGLIERGVQDAIAVPEMIVGEANATIDALKDTVGNVVRSPSNISNMIRNSIHSGGMSRSRITTNASLGSGGGGSDGDALIDSGKPYSASEGASL